MKSKIYIYISTIVFFVLIINLWKVKINISHSYISVNDDVIFIDSHIDFKRDIYKDPSDPWIPPIMYCVEKPVSEENVKIAISAIENNTCVKFQKQDHCNNDRQEIIFKEGPICASWIGHVSGEHSQIINLTYDCYNRPPSILHEIGHALGLIHEQSRRDRDEFVEIDYNSLTSNQGHNFQVYRSSKYKNFTTSYEYASIMHYEPYTFATTWRWLFGYPVIKPKVHWQYSSMMGQRKKMTFNEYKRINLCYCNKCKWVDDQTGKRNKYHRTPCRNGGYPNYKDCSKCVCPTGYTGDHCQDIISSDERCGNTTFKVNDTGTLLILKGKMNCNIFLHTENKTKKIELNILYANAPYEDKICTEDVGFQFKYRKDKGATGLLLCGPYIDNTIVKSESDSILVMFKVNYDRFFKNDHVDFKREILKDLNHSWIFPIKYYIGGYIIKENVRTAISALQNNTCVTFSEQNKTFNDTQGLIFQLDSACVSYIGNALGMYSQPIGLSLKCFLNPYTILHEIGHALDLVHEHTRIDRDKYVTIDFGSLVKNEEENFKILNNSRFRNYSTTYDYSALMHYAPYDFATTLRWFFGFPVIKPKLRQELSRMMGQRKKMTYNEYKRINLCYCNWCGWVKNDTGKRVPNHTTSCRNG